MSDVTQIISNIEAGDPVAAEQLLPLVYEELRRLAAARLARENPGHTLQATALVHEAYLRLIGSGECIEWHSRGHFFGAAAEAMRRILIDEARRKGRDKRGGAWDRCTMDKADFVRSADPTILEVDEAISKFELVHPEKAKLVKLRYFAGMTLSEAAMAAGISASTADRYWKYARAWLSAELCPD